MVTILRSVKKVIYKIIGMSKGAIIGQNSLVHYTVQLSLGVRIGAHSYIGPNSNFRGKVNIGDYFLCADNVHLVGGDHNYGEVGVPVIFAGRDNNVYYSDTSIGHDVWIGRNVTIMRGVSIGDGVIVGAGSVVNKNLDAGYIYAGVPAKKIRARFNHQDFKNHLNNIGKK